MKIKTGYNIYEIFVIISIVLTIFLSLISNIDKGYHYIVVIPLVYGILFILNNPLHNISKKYNGMLILNVILYIKYIVTTFFIIVNKDYSTPVYTGTVPTAESCSFAIFYIVIEMLFVFFTIYVLGYKFYKNNSDEENYDIKFDKVNISIILIIFIIVVSVIAFTNLRQFISSQLLFGNTNGYADEKITSRSIRITFFCFKNYCNGVNYKSFYN